MKKTNRLVAAVCRLIGQSRAYDTVEGVTEVIRANAFSTLTERVQTHSRGAGRLTDSLAFQPGLVDLHDELHDVWHYLVALKARARELGYGEMAVSMGAAADHTCDVLEAVARAAEQTVPAPQIPLSK